MITSFEKEVEKGDGGTSLSESNPPPSTARTLIKASQLILKTFTNKPKFIRRGRMISGLRARSFMEHLWEVGLHDDISYEALICYWNQLYECGTRTLTKYCGSPPWTAHSGRRYMNRTNSMNGNAAQFNYNYTREVRKKTGLLETLGFITWNQQLYEATKPRRVVTQNRYRLNHEMMPYYTEQVTLEVLPQAPSPTGSFNEDSVTQSIPSLCVRNVVVGSDGVGIVVDGVGDALYGDSDGVYVETNGEREERESIGTTHTNQSSESKLSEDSP